MNQTPAPSRQSRRLVVGCVLILAALAAFAGYQLAQPWVTATPAASSPTVSTWTSSAPQPSHPPRRQPRDGTIDESDGVVGEGVTVFDDNVPAVGKLDSELLKALRAAARAAADYGVEFYITSGWRSAAYQDQLLREAVAEYGSEEEAARWVATAETSPHVTGDAVDVGHTDATTWLADNGAGYDLCQIYRNEPWHYELRPGAADDGCPNMYADPTEDPRMRQ